MTYLALDYDDAWDDTSVRETDLCPVCFGAGGWQQNDGLTIECPRGCWTEAAA